MNILHVWEVSLLPISDEVSLAFIHSEIRGIISSQGFTQVLLAFKIMFYDSGVILYGSNIKRVFILYRVSNLF
jgi:hypothetical protein